MGKNLIVFPKYKHTMAPNVPFGSLVKVFLVLAFLPIISSCVREFEGFSFDSGSSDTDFFDSWLLTKGVSNSFPLVLGMPSGDLSLVQKQIEVKPNTWVRFKITLVRAPEDSGKTLTMDLIGAGYDFGEQELVLSCGNLSRVPKGGAITYEKIIPTENCPDQVGFRIFTSSETAWIISRFSMAEISPFQAAFSAKRLKVSQYHWAGEAIGVLADLVDLIPWVVFWTLGWVVLAWSKKFQWMNLYIFSRALPGYVSFMVAFVSYACFTIFLSTNS